MKPLQLLPVLGCALRGDKELAVGRSVSVFRVLPDGEPDFSVQFGLLHFEFQPLASLGGRPALVSFLCNDVPVGTCEVSGVLPSPIWLYLREVNFPCYLRMVIDARPSDRLFEEPVENYEPCFGTVSHAWAEVQANEFLNRDHIVLAARDWAERINLTEDYLGDELAGTIQAEILASLEGGVPYSIVRLGDTEGRVLGFPDFFTDQELLLQVLYYQFGPNSMHLLKERDGAKWIENSVQFLRKRLILALNSADRIGYPVYDFYRHLQQGVDAGTFAYACALFIGLAYNRRRGQPFIGTNIFQLAASKGVIFKPAIQAAKRVILVGPWDLTGPLSGVTGKQELLHIAVPGHFTWRGAQGFGQFPELYQFVEHKLAALGDLRGDLVLVGAGIVGKYYVHLAKLQGAVALDVGAVFDGWAKKGIPYAAQDSALALDRL